MVSIAGCTLEENSAIKGGAIYAKGSLVKASNSVFAKNTAFTATAVRNFGNDYNSITFINCTFEQDSERGCMFNLVATDVTDGAKYTPVALHNCIYTSTSPALCLGSGTGLAKLLYDGSSTGFDSSSTGFDGSLVTCHTSTGFEWLHTERKALCICSAG
jgi:predicted outer membrane repeat protein